MRLHGVPPDVVSFNTGLKALLVRAMYREALEIFLQLEETVTPDATSFTLLFTALAKVGINDQMVPSTAERDTMPATEAAPIGDARLDYEDFRRIPGVPPRVDNLAASQQVRPRRLQQRTYLNGEPSI